MKKPIIILTFISSLFLLAFGDNLNQALHIFHDGKREPVVIPSGAIDKIEFQASEDAADGFNYLVNTEEGKMVFSRVDSICLNLPHLTGYKHIYTVPDEDGDIIVNVSCSGESEDDCPMIQLPNGRREEMNPEENKYTYRFSHKKKNKETYDTLFVESKELRDTLILHNTGEEFYKNNPYSTIVFPKEGGDFEFNSSLPIGYWCSLASTHPKIDDDNRRFHFDENKDLLTKEFIMNIEKIGDLNLDRSVHFYVSGYTPIHTSDTHKAALLDLYNSCNGKNWKGKQNWLTDKPFWEWEGINNDGTGGIWLMDYVRQIRFRDEWRNGVRGTIPESFTVFMDDAEELDLSHCDIYGEIPYSVRHHEKWQQFGWPIINRNPRFDGELDFTDINLHIDDVETENFMTGEKSTTYKELAKNKITWVFNGGAVDDIDGINDLRVNKFLDYKSKGLGLVVTVSPIWETPYDKYKEWVMIRQQRFGLPKEIQWTKGFDKGAYGSQGSMSVLDSVGNLLYYMPYIYEYFDPKEYETRIVNTMDSIFRQHLGEPVSHPVYISSAYSSTDYSEDGKVVTLQKATVGRGIDLVLLGDQYIDTWMGEGGMYETDMNEAMETFFSAEPFATFRDRFNVYMVKVVSKNSYEGDDHRINNNNGVCFEYASKIQGIDLENVTIAVIKGNPNFAWSVSAYTEMFDSGASIAYLNAGGSNSIVHEAGGHGFAKLLDEYVFDEFQDAEIPEESKDEFKEWMRASYHDRGWGVNVAATDNPEEVPWSHFLKDSRYADEVGIYQGAWMYPKDLWRSSETSNMREFSNPWFNAPSREAIYKRVMSLSEGEDWEYDYETFVAFDQEVMKKTRKKAAEVYTDRSSTPSVPAYRPKFVERKEQCTNVGGLTLPKNARLIRAEDYKGDIKSARTINIGGTVYVRE